MIKCGIRKLYLFTILLVVGLYLWAIGHTITAGTFRSGTIIILTMIFLFPIYLALFQVKTVQIKNGLITIFYPFRLWKKTYNLDQIHSWKYRKKTKAIRFQVYFRSRYLILKFENNLLLTFLFSLGLTNFDKLLDYLNERHKDRRTNRIGM